jgi:hypothetical protein
VHVDSAAGLFGVAAVSIMAMQTAPAYAPDFLPSIKLLISLNSTLVLPCDY